MSDPGQRKGAPAGPASEADRPVRIFLSYRRADSGDHGSGHARAIYNDLARRFGRERVFRDVDSIAPGEPWDEAVDEAIGSCDVLIALIGTEWWMAADDEGKRRLDDPGDRLGRELEAGLNAGLKLIPVLVGGAEMPSGGELPENLRKLTMFQAHPIPDHTYDYSLERLIERIEKIEAKAHEAVEEEERRAEKERKRREQEKAEDEEEKEKAEKAEEEQRRRAEEERERREEQERDRAEKEERKRRKAEKAKEPAFGALALGRRSIVALGAIAIAVCAAAGFLLGSSGGDGSAASLENSASAGTIELSYPDGWARVNDGPTIPGMHFAEPMSLAPDGGDGSSGLVVGQVAAVGPTLLPAGLLRRVEGETPAGEPVRLDGLEALRYDGLTPKGFPGQLRIFAVPTDRGVATVVCSSDGETPASVLDECEAIATSLGLVAAAPYPLEPSEEYAAELDGSIAKLNESLPAKREQLGAAKTPDAQASALAEIGDAYASAATAIGGVKVSPEALTANRSIQSALVAARDSYRSLASAARSGDEAGYAAARSAVRRADRRIERALQGLRELGFEVG